MNTWVKMFCLLLGVACLAITAPDLGDHPTIRMILAFLGGVLIGAYVWAADHDA